MSIRKRQSATGLVDDQVQPQSYNSVESSSSAESGQAPKDDVSDEDESLTISYEDSLRLVPWQTDNDYIRSGYRRQLFTLSACVKSAFTYLHNETVNIHTHSIGAVVFAGLIPLHLFPSTFPISPLLGVALPRPHTTHDKVALVLNLSCAVACLGLSSWFHTVQCHSQETCNLAHTGDYVGIVILTTGSIVPGLYYGFHGSPKLQIFYMGAVIAAGVASAYVVLSPHHRKHRWHRTLVFIGLGLSSVIPIAHVLLTRGLQYAREFMALDLTAAGGAAYIFGAVLYAARVPERFKPGKFDYFGASHQIFHCFVLVGAASMYAALRAMVWGRSAAVPLL